MAHPQHRLNGKFVKVLGRETGQWIIARPDGSPEDLPFTWAEPLPSIIAQEESAEPWAGVTELLNLVTMIERLRGQLPEEVDDETQPANVDPAGRDFGGGDSIRPDNAGCRGQEFGRTGVGSVPAGETGGTGADSGRDAGTAGTASGGE